jgi:hypothetical protein
VGAVTGTCQHEYLPSLESSVTESIFSNERTSAGVRKMPNGTGKRTSKLEPRLLRFSVLLVLQLLGSLEPHSANCATLTVRKKEDNGHMYVQRANASGCRIVSPVCGTAITVDSTNSLFGSQTDGSSYVRFDAHLYNISPKDLSTAESGDQGLARNDPH